MTKSRDDSPKRLRSRPILLVGLPGSGKSTVGRLLARLLLSPYQDLDLLYQEEYGETPATAIMRKGEARFRRNERTLLMELVGYEPLVLATGGGTLAHEGTLSTVMKRAIVVYLHAEPETAAARLGTGLNHPLLDDTDLEGSLRALYRRRRSFYLRSLLRVHTDRLSPWDVAVEIRKQLLRYRPDEYRWHQYPPEFRDLDGGVEECVVDSDESTCPVRLVSGESEWDALGDFLGETLGNREQFWMVDAHVLRCYSKEIQRLAGSERRILALPEGEPAKRFSGMESLLEGLVSRGATRSSALVAVGGGSTTDAAGFLASIFMRGIPLVTVPTTLLGAVDASVGGKTAANLSKAKNIPGSFWVPRGVYIPLSVVEQEIKKRGGIDGAAELFKMALLEQSTESVHAWLARWGGGLDRDSLRVIVRDGVAYKASVVALDPRESHGDRMILNLGHTFAHVVEAASGYEISHGRAVAWGLVVSARISVQLGLAEPGLVTLVESGCRVIGAWPPPDLSLSRESLRRLLVDKKRDGDSLTMVLLEKPGIPVLMRMSLERAENLLHSLM